MTENLPPPNADSDQPPATSPRADDRAMATRGAQPVQTTVLQAPPHAAEDELDLLAYWHILVKRRWLILGTIAVVLVLAVIHTLLTPSIFRATAMLQITNSGMQVMEVQGMRQASDWDPDFAQTQYQLLQSRDLAQRVAEDLHLPGSNIFQRLEPPSWLERVRGLWAPARHVAASAPRPATPVVAPTPAVAEQQLREATRLIEGGLVIEPIRNTHLVRINYDSTSPQFSAQVANAVADGFIASSMDRDVGASSYASKYLKDQLDQLRSRLEQSERKLVAYAQQEQIVPTDKGSSLVAQNLADLNTSLATVQAKRIQAQALWDEVKAANSDALPTDLTVNPLLGQLQTQLATLQSQYQDQLKTFKPDYPSMAALQGRITAVKRQIDGALAGIRASVKAQYDAAATQEKMLTDQLAQLRTSALEVDSRSIKYNILKRDVDTDRQLYNALLQRYKEVGMAGGVRPSNIAVIDRALVPTSRYSPSLARNATLGLLLGIFLGIGGALVLEYLDNTVKTPDDMEKRLQLGVLGIIPKLGRQTMDEALIDLRSAFAESYRSARTALQFSTDRGVPRTLLITSPQPEEGKSTTALVLARGFAQLGKRVLLIEADLRNPSLARTLHLDAQTGLSTVLSGAALLPAAVVADASDPRLEIMVSGPLPPSPAELLASARFVSLLTLAANKYDQVVIDGPPVLGLADAPILANVAEGTMLVIRAGSTPIDAARLSLKRLRAAHAHLIGGLLTWYDAHAGGYGYEGSYYSYGGSPRLPSA